MFRKYTKKYRPIQEYKVGQWVYVYHEGILQSALISGVLFDYNSKSRENVFVSPTYKVELHLYSGAHCSIFVEEHEIFETKEECAIHALEHGLIEQEE